MNIPKKLERREKRLAGIAAAKAELEKRAAERHAHEQAAFEEMPPSELKKNRKLGKKSRGRIFGIFAAFHP